MTSYAAACCCKDDDDDGGGDGGDGIPGCCDTNPNLVTVNVNLTACRRERWRLPRMHLAEAR